MTSLACLPGQLLLSCSEDRSLRVWDLKTMKQIHVSLECLLLCMDVAKGVQVVSSLQWQNQGMLQLCFHNLP